MGRVVIGTVKGDLHDIGKNLVASMLEGGGFEVIDLGADVAPERFVEAAAARNANLVALSALLTVTMTSMKTTIDAFGTAGLREQGEDHGGRRAGHPAVRRCDRGRRLWRKRGSRGGAGAQTGGGVSRLRDWLADGLLITDGAWGTELQARGLEPGAAPDIWNLTHPGSRGRGGARLCGSGQPGDPDQHFPRQRHRDWTATWRRSIARVWRFRSGRRPGGAGICVNRSDGQDADGGRNRRGAGAAAFAAQAVALAAAGADALLVETMSDIEEARLAVAAASDTGLPVIVSFAFDSGKHKDRTMTGATPEAVARGWWRRVRTRSAPTAA